MHRGTAHPTTLNGLALAATLRCNAATIALSVALAFVFGYLLTTPPLLRTVAFPVVRWLIEQGRGHAVVHGPHGAPPRDRCRPRTDNDSPLRASNARAIG